MRVCQVTCVHDRYDSRIFQRIATSLAYAGFESYLLVVDSNGTETKDGVKIVNVCFEPKNRLQRILQSWKKLRKKALDIDADIYHLHDPELLPLGKWLKRHKKKVIFDSHEDYKNISQKKWIPRPFRKLVQKFYLFYEKKTLSLFDGVISVTPHIVDRLKTINKNTIMITNYPKLIDKYNHSFENKIICFGGNPFYLHETVIKALSLLNGQVKYHLVTDIKSKRFEELKNIKGFEYVIAENYMPFEQLRLVYKHSSLGVIPDAYTINTNYKEGSLGVLKLFEFMMEGMPVICTDFSLWKEIVDKYGCGITINPYDELEMANAIKRLIDDPSLMKAMGENGRIAAEKEFNWSTQEPKLFDFYQKIYRHPI